MTNGTLSITGQRDWLAVTLTADQAYLFTLTGLTDGASVAVGAAEIRCKVVRALERQGATGIEMHAGQVQFRAERAIFNLNPLTPCRAGSFEVERVPQGIRVRYQLD